MFTTQSRYASLETLYYTSKQGKLIPYKARRFIPKNSAASGPALIRTVVEVNVSDRLDTLAASALGNPELFWKLADFNGPQNPFELCTPGNTLKVPVA